MRNTKQLLLTLILAAACIPTISYGQNTSSEPSAEARKQMAAAHKKMADCLTSNKSAEECRREMSATMQSVNDHYWSDHHQKGGMMGHHDDDYHGCW